MGRRIARALEYLRELPIQRPWFVVLLTLLSLVPSGLAASRLTVRTSLHELLPESQPSVIELRRTNHRLTGSSTLIVVAEGRDADSLGRFIRELSPRIRALGPHYVAGVDTGGEALRGYIEAHKFLYADLGELQNLRDDIVQRYDYEVGKRTGLDLGIADEEPPPIDEATLRARMSRESAHATDRLPPNEYIGEDGRLAAIVVRTPFEAGDPRAFELEQRIRECVRQVEPERWDPSLSVHFTGNLVTSAEEHRAVTSDLAHVGALGIAMILGVVFLFFLRVRVLCAMVVTIGTGLVWTFGFAYLAVSYLNSATGFLVSIVAGNGINFGIILMARYLEARISERQNVESAVRTALRTTAAATSSVALAAAIAYGALAFTDFRGFRDFGVIGGIGMALCWIASYTLLPALLVLGERLLPIRTDLDDWRNRLRGLYGRPFAYVATKAPRLLLAVGLVSGVVALVLTVRYVRSDPYEYDLSRIRNEDPTPTSARALARRVDPIVGRFGREGRALLADRPDQVAPLVAELERRRALAPDHQKPFGRVVSVLDLVPDDQPKKLALVAEILDRLGRAHKRGIVSDADYRRLTSELPSDPRPVTIADLPSELAWPFEEANGTRGLIVYLVPTEGRSVNDLHYLALWADSFRQVRLLNDDVIRGSGDPVIYVDMLESVRHEAPKALGIATLGTLLVILFAFRGRATASLAFGSVALGLFWLLGFFTLSGTRINFLNFVALPISVGVGTDYALNLLKRWEIEGRRHLERVLIETGGAVVLCSMTTLLGYAALAFSINGAVRSFGIAAAIGEVVMLAAAMLVVPAALQIQRRQQPMLRRLRAA